MFLYTIMLQKIDKCYCKKAAWKSAKAVGKDSSSESEGLHRVYRQKDNCTQTESLWNFAFWKTHAKLSIATCSHILLTCLSVVLFIVAELGFIIQYDTVQAPVASWCNNLCLAGKQLGWDKIPSNSNSVFARSDRFLLSVSHIHCTFSVM